MAQPIFCCYIPVAAAGLGCGGSGGTAHESLVCGIVNALDNSAGGGVLLWQLSVICIYIIILRGSPRPGPGVPATFCAGSLIIRPALLYQN